MDQVFRSQISNKLAIVRERECSVHWKDTRSVRRKRLPQGREVIQWTLNQLIFMAKTSWIEREKKKSATVAKYAALRAELKAKGDYIGLSLLPKNASPVRVSKRCLQSGRKRAYIGRFKLSRIAFRELASNGMIPGVTKSSW
jgi:small subunit ribosomal protein S14